MYNLSLIANEMNKSNKMLASQSLFVQAYVNSVVAQNNIDFEDPRLKLSAKKINSFLDGVKVCANIFLAEVLRDIIYRVGGMENYFALHDGVISTMNKGTGVHQWIDCLSLLQTTVSRYVKDISITIRSLKQLYLKLAPEVTYLLKSVFDFNMLVHGENGIIETENEKIDNVNRKIGDYITGGAVLSFGIPSGIYIMLLGGVANFITKGTSIPLLLGGGALFLGGESVAISFGILLSGLLNEKANLYIRNSRLIADIQLALGISNGSDFFAKKMQDLTLAASHLQSTLELLANYLNKLIRDLRNRMITPVHVRCIFLSSRSEVKKVLVDSVTIRRKMAGVTMIKAKPNQTIADLTLQVSQSFVK